MSIQDPIADMLTRIRNAQRVSKKTVSMPHSKLKSAIADVLEDEGYILGAEQTTGEDTHPTLTIRLKYFEGRPVIARLERVSLPSLRIYKPANDLPRVENGLGIAIVTTSKGVMAAYKARQMGLGGEVLCIVS